MAHLASKLGIDGTAMYACNASYASYVSLGSALEQRSRGKKKSRPKRSVSETGGFCKFSLHGTVPKIRGLVDSRKSAVAARAHRSDGPDPPGKGPARAVEGRSAVRAPRPRPAPPRPCPAGAGAFGLGGIANTTKASRASGGWKQGASAAGLGGAGAECTASGVPRETFWPRGPAFPQIPAPLAPYFHPP